MKKVFTLCLIVKDGRILLGMKKRGFGMGKWNGFGGKVQPGETIEEAARRELFEEVGLEVPELEKIGINEFEFPNNPVALEVHVYKAIDFTGEPTESDEMRPEWFAIADIPYKKMWSDDIYWFPLFLEGKKFKGKYLFDDKEEVIKYSLLEADVLT